MCRPINFVQFYPLMNVLRGEVRLSQSQEREATTEAPGLHMMDFSKLWVHYRLGHGKGEVAKYPKALSRLWRQTCQ